MNNRYGYFLFLFTERIFKFMNEDIKKGATLLAKGLKDEAKVLSENVKDLVDRTKAKLDPDNDGKIQFDEAKNILTAEAKEGFDKLKALVKDEEVPLKVKAELIEVMDKIKPVFEAKKEEVAAYKEKVEEKFEQVKDVVEDKLETVEDKIESAEDKVEAEVEQVKDTVEEKIEEVEEN